MHSHWQQHRIWAQVIALALVPWANTWAPSWIPILLAGAVLLIRQSSGELRFEAIGYLTVAASALAFLALIGGIPVASLWVVLAGLAGLLAWLGPATVLGGTRIGEIAALSAWGVVFVVRPDLVEPATGGWITPAVLLYAAVRVGGVGAETSEQSENWPLPPAREVRGTLSLRGVVLRDEDGLPRTVPLDVELRAGESMAVLCDSAKDAESLVRVLAGRASAHAGEIMIDGSPLETGEALVAVVAAGERFLAADLDANLAALSETPLSDSERTAVIEACSLVELAERLRNRALETDGAPLSRLERLQILVARVIPSHYRLMVVRDADPWLDAIAHERWRAGLVRASVGRTSIWITTDHELACRANRAVMLRDGGLRSVSLIREGG
ncbi:MAG: hypothetical protein GY906_09910 [bacterium]|nr:hypothetical protein [bacterium]